MIRLQFSLAGFLVSGFGDLFFLGFTRLRPSSAGFSVFSLCACAAVMLCGVNICLAALLSIPLGDALIFIHAFLSLKHLVSFSSHLVSSVRALAAAFPLFRTLAAAFPLRRRARAQLTALETSLGHVESEQLQLDRSIDTLEHTLRDKISSSTELDAAQYQREQRCVCFCAFFGWFGLRSISDFLFVSVNRVVLVAT